MIPIIGAPQILDYAISLTVKCSCGHVFLIAGQITTQRPCTGEGCKKIYSILGVPKLDHTGNITAPIGVAEGK